METVQLNLIFQFFVLNFVFCMVNIMIAFLLTTLSICENVSSCKKSLNNFYIRYIKFEKLFNNLKNFHAFLAIDNYHLILVRELDRDYKNI